MKLRLKLFVFCLAASGGFVSARPARGASPAEIPLSPRATAPPKEGPAGYSPVLFSAMEKEMKRSLTRLKFEKFPAPYFLAYSLQDQRESSFQARYGTVLQDQSYRSRAVYVELRTGDPDRDNTDENYRGQYDSASLEDSEEDLRHRLWLLTDQAYKQAVKDALQKQGKQLTEVEKEKVPDFSKEKPSRDLLDVPLSSADFKTYKEALRAASGDFRKTKEILDSGISFRWSRKAVYYLNSEGSKVYMPVGGNAFYFYLWARAQSDDGMNLDVSRTFSVDRAENLPGEEKLRATVAEIAEQLLQLRLAHLADPYTGPAILDPESTGVLFHEAVGHRLEGERQRDEEEGQTFKGQLGKPIIPTFLSVTDDPTLKEWNGVPLNGFYAYDDEGVPAQRVDLVTDGILKGYLLSRRPISGFPKSNGHGRAQFGRDPIGRMSSLFVKSTRERSLPELKKMLLEECARQKKPYGLLIRRTRSGDTFTGRGRYQAFRGTPEEVFLVEAQTGAETLVRGVEIVGTPLITINKILATGSDATVLNAYCGAESGMIPISAVAPSALVEEVELQRVREDKQRPPILPPPLFDKDGSQ